MLVTSLAALLAAKLDFFEAEWWEIGKDAVKAALSVKN